MSRIDAKFAGLKAEGKAAFVSFVMAGDPDYTTSLEIVRGLPEELDATATIQAGDVQIISQTAPLQSWVPAAIDNQPVHPSGGIAA